MSDIESEFEVAADFTLYSNPVHRALALPYRKLGAAARPQPARPKVDENKGEEKLEDMIASDMTKYDSPLASLDRFGKDHDMNDKTDNEHHAKTVDDKETDSGSKDDNTVKTGSKDDNTVKTDNIKLVKSSSNATKAGDPKVKKESMSKKSYSVEVNSVPVAPWKQSAETTHKDPMHKKQSTLTI